MGLEVAGIWETASGQKVTGNEGPSPGEVKQITVKCKDLEMPSLKCRLWGTHESCLLFVYFQLYK